MWENPQDWRPTEVIEKGFLANGGCRIHEEHAVDVISNAGSLEAKGGSWDAEMWGENFPKCGKFPKMGRICAQQRQFWGVLWPTEYAESKKNMPLTLYLVLGLLEAQGGSWDAEMWGENFPQCGKIPKMGTQQR